MSNILLFHEIRKLLPYTPPFLFVDKILDWSINEWIEVEKVISGSDPIVYSHLINGPPVIPGVILIEFVGQASLLLDILSGNNNYKERLIPGEINVLARCKADFFSPAFVGDVIKGKIRREATVKNKTVIAGEIEGKNGVKICKVELYTATVTSNLYYDNN